MTSSPKSTIPPDIVAFATRIYDAARQGQIELFKQALPAGLSANMTNHKGDSLIMLAAYHGHAALVELLLAHGANPNLLNDRNQSPLAGAVFKNETAVVTALLEGAADPDLGTPSAAETMMLFKLSDVWEESFHEARQKLRSNAESNGKATPGEDSEVVRKKD